MKVLFVTREYPPFEVGGIGVHTFKLVEHLTKLGICCQVVSFGDKRFSTDKITFVNPASSILEKSPGNLGSNAKIPLDVLRFSRIANSIIEKNKFDIIHVEEPYVGGYIRGSNIPKITTFHTTSLGEINALARDRITAFGLKKMGFYLLRGINYEALCIASSTSLIVPADPIKRELTNLYRASKDKIQIIENGVDAPKITLVYNKASAKRKLGVDPDTKLILSVARIVSRKRLDLLIKAAKLLVTKDLCKFQFVIAGMGPERSALLNLVEQYRLQGVVDLPGWLSEDLRNLYYQAADIFVLSSDYEGFPFTVLEAMSFGASIVSARIESLETLRDRSELLFFSPGDHDSLSKCIEEVLENPRLQKHMSLSAKSFASMHSWEKTALETKKLYEKFL